MTIHIWNIGDNYPGTPNELRGCVNDAHDTGDTFRQYAASSALTIDSAADRDGIMKAGHTFLQRLAPGDLGIISNSSHGTREKIAGAWHEAIVCADFELIYDREFDKLLSKRADGSFLAVFSDSCYSGGLPRGVGNANGNGTYRKARTIPLSSCRQHKLEDRSATRALPEVIYFSGCEEPQVSWDGEFNDRPNGAMTYYLLKSFRELKSPSLTFGQLFQRLAGKRPRGYLPTDEYPQTPVCVASSKNLKRTLKSFTEGK